MSAAGDLINYLKAIADEQINEFESAADALRVSANTGEVIRVDPNKPAAYSSPTIPFPTLPAAPANTVLDASAMTTAVQDLINNLNGTWMKNYFPTNFNDTNTALENLLDARIDLDDLNDILADLRAGILAAVTTLRAQLDSAIATSKSNLDANVAGLQPKIDAALDQANDDAADIAWARARDQAAREAVRQELEAIADWAARGFSLPGGVLTAQAEISRQNTLNASSAMAAEQAVQISKHYLDIAKMAVDNWLKAAQLQMESEIEAYKTSEQLRIKTAELEMEGYKEQARTELQALGLEVDLSKFAGDVAARYQLGIHSAINGLVNAYADAARTGLDSKARIAESHRSVISAMADYYRAAINSAEVTQRGSLQNREQDMNWTKIGADTVASFSRNLVQSASATADVYARVAAMALSGLNGVASVSAQES